MMRLGAVTFLACLAGCMNTSAPLATRSPATPLALPAAHLFGAYVATPPQRSNAAIAQDILDLSFHMESGRTVPVLSRFEKPVTVRMTGDVPPTAPQDLARLVARLRAEAGLDISLTGSETASITVEFLPRRVLARVAPQAACFVSPRVSDWSGYRASLRSGASDWTTLTLRETEAIFIPSDFAPQEIRDCLNEELSQGLGPLNDLYRLPDSVDNDDNMQGLLTGFDMLVLSALYAPDLHSGMTEGEVAARLPGILARINPRGAQGMPQVRAPETPRSYVDAIARAVGSGVPVALRRAAAGEAVAIADAQGWHDNRAGFAWLILGRLLAGSDPSRGLAALIRAQEIYRAAGLGLQSAHVDMQLAAFALNQGDAEGAIRLADAASGPAMQAQNAGLLASLLMVKAEALDLMQRPGDAEAVRLDSLAWARYGFGSDAAIRAHLAEIRALSPVGRSRQP